MTDPITDMNALLRQAHRPIEQPQPDPQTDPATTDPKDN